MLYFNTNKPHSFFFFAEYRKPQVISGGRGAHPLHPPPRSAPGMKVEIVYVRFYKRSSSTTRLNQA